MKKSLVILTVLVASLALAGVAFAQVCGPVCAPGCDLQCSTKSKPWTGKWVGPKAGPIKPPKCVTPKCGPPITIPGTPYANAPVLENKVVVKTVDVMRDLCVGKDKGKCKLCGPCAPDIKWQVAWKTSEIIGKTDVKYVLPPAYQWCNESGCPTGAVNVTCVPKPCPPPAGCTY